jgi:hypothetical protein
LAKKFVQWSMAVRDDKLGYDFGRAMIQPKRPPARDLEKVLRLITTAAVFAFLI